MYALYKANANWDGTAVVSDLVKLLTNDLNIANYSTSCDKLTTQIIVNTAPNNWTLYDGAAGAYSYVLASTEANGVAVKYLRITGSTTGITFQTYTAWNPVTHTGTNPGQNSNSFDGFNGNNASSLTILLWQSSTYLIAQVGVSGSWRYPIIWSGELDRNSTFTDFWSVSTNPISFSGLAVFHSYSNTEFTYANMTWAKAYYSSAYSTNAGQRIMPLSIIGPTQYQSFLPSNFARNIDDTNNGLLITPLYVAIGGSGFTLMMGGIVKDILFISFPVAGVNPLDEIIINGTTYVVLLNNSVGSTRSGLLVPKQ